MGKTLMKHKYTSKDLYDEYKEKHYTALQLGNSLHATLASKETIDQIDQAADNYKTLMLLYYSLHKLRSFGII